MAKGKVKSPDFISDAEMESMAANEPPDFIPDEAMPREKQPEVMLSPKGIQAASTGFLQAATLGHQPQLQALTDPITDRIYNLFAEREVEPAPFRQMIPGSKEYISARDRAIAEQEKLKREAPVSFGSGEVGGLIASSAIPGALAGKAVQAGRYGQAALQGAKSGALLGFLQNPGDVKGQASPQLGERAGGAAFGAAIGGALGAGTEAVAQGVRAVGRIPQKLRDFSDEMAFRQLGPTKRDLKQMIKADRGETLKGVKELGRFVREKGLVRGGENIEEVATRVSQATDDAGSQIGALYDRVTEKLGMLSPKALKPEARKAIEQTNLAPKELANRVLEDIKAKYTGKSGGRQAVSAVTRELENLRDLGAQPTSIQNIFDYRKGLDRKIYDKATDNITKDALIDVRRSIQKAVDDRIKAADTVLGTQESGLLRSLSKEYGMLAKARDMTNDQLARQASNQFFSLTDKIIGAGALASQLPQVAEDPTRALKGVGLGLLAAGGSRMARTMGAPMAMRGSEMVGKAIQDTAQLVRANFANVTPSLVKDLAKQARDRYGKEAADRIFKNPAFYSALGIRMTDNEVKRGE